MNAVIVLAKEHIMSKCAEVALENLLSFPEILLFNAPKTCCNLG